MTTIKERVLGLMDNGEEWTSSTLGTKLGLKTQTVSKCLGELVRNGYIVVLRQEKGVRCKNQNHYQAAPDAFLETDEDIERAKDEAYRERNYAWWPSADPLISGAILAMVAVGRSA